MNNTSRIPLKEKVALYPENRMFGTVLPAAGFYVRHAKNIQFNNVCLKTLSQDKRPMFYLDGVEDIDIRFCKNNRRQADVKSINTGQSDFRIFIRIHY
jgi:hypothetical protein